MPTGEWIGISLDTAVRNFCLTLTVVTRLHVKKALEILLFSKGMNLSRVLNFELDYGRHLVG